MVVLAAKQVEATTVSKATVEEPTAILVHNHDLTVKTINRILVKMVVHTINHSGGFNFCEEI